MSMITQEILDLLSGNQPVRDRSFKSHKTKVIRLKVGSISTRIKITPSQAIFIKDNNDAFVEGLFPDFTERWRDRMNRSDHEDLKTVITYMRIRMELRTDLISAAFSAPVETLSLLEREHDTY